MRPKHQERRFIAEGRRKKEVGRRKKEEAVIAMVSAIKNVLTVLAVAICTQLCKGKGARCAPGES
ncbi:hypothetical protein QUA13_16870 [Microcoleus sp. S28C3]|uniref:hypothetical protein n=1 Tax=Microcoleus sp. S28C3 TaxID=3055414 RepID=UPI002FD08363